MSAAGRTPVIASTRELFPAVCYRSDMARTRQSKQDIPDWLPMTAILGIRISFDALQLTI